VSDELILIDPTTDDDKCLGASPSVGRISVRFDRPTGPVRRTTSGPDLVGLRLRPAVRDAANYGRTAKGWPLCNNSPSKRARSSSTSECLLRGAVVNRIVGYGSEERQVLHTATRNVFEGLTCEHDTAPRPMPRARPESSLAAPEDVPRRTGRGNARQRPWRDVHGSGSGAGRHRRFRPGAEGPQYGTVELPDCRMHFCDTGRRRNANPHRDRPHRRS
jgi:hypothetical protein